MIEAIQQKRRHEQNMEKKDAVERKHKMEREILLDQENQKKKINDYREACRK